MKGKEKGEREREREGGREREREGERREGGVTTIIVQNENSYTGHCQKRQTTITRQ